MRALPTGEPALAQWSAPSAHAPPLTFPGPATLNFPQTLTDADRAVIRKRMEDSIKASHRFERIVVSRDEALGMFQENKFKVAFMGSGKGKEGRACRR